MLERLLSRWKGKLLVLALLGFAATDFVITVTLSAADAAAHAVENPFIPSFLHGQNMLITLVLIALLGAVYLKGFAEAVGVAVVLTAVYLVLNLVVSIANAIAATLPRIRDETDILPHVYFAWAEGNPFKAIGRYLIFGDGDIPPVTREVLRRAEPEPERRPLVHVG